MNQAPTDWTTAIIIAVAGLILGTLFIFLFNRKKAAPVLDSDLERKDLEAKRDALIAQLRALPDDAVDERARLEAETAIVLRDLDKRGGQAILPAKDTRDRVSSTMNPAVKGFLWGAGSFAALAVMLFLVYQTSTPRTEGGSVTGGFPGDGQQGGQAATQTGAPDPMVQQLEAAVQKDPANNQLRLDLAQMYLERDNLMGVFEQTKVVLDREPQNARALTFGALVRMAMGETDTAVGMLQQATTVDPKNLDAWVALAWIHAQTNKMADAEKAIAQAKSVSPENAGRLDDVLAQMKSHAAGQGAQMASAQPMGGDMPPNHPPITAAPQPAAPTPAAAPAGAAGPNVKVTLQLGGAASAKSGIVFVIARPLTGGPPVAVKRMQVASFPVTFDFGSADSMMGQPLPAKFRLEARLDSDGDAATKPPTDPSGFIAEAAPGNALTLALK